MRYAAMIVVLVIPYAQVTSAHSQAVITGRITHPRFAGATEVMPLTAVYGFASLGDAERPSLGTRTWETEPAGWYRFVGPAGRYTLAFSTPGHFMRPLIVPSSDIADRATLDRILKPNFDYAVFSETHWDEKPAAAYFQPFVATGTSITHAGFRLATDGVDGPGPGSQNMLLSIHRRVADTPDHWPQVGPTAVVLDVDCGGAKGYWYSAGWNSGEVPTTPGETYAVQLRAQKPGGTLQAFWRPAADPHRGCYRVAAHDQAGFSGRDLWLAVGGDGDGLAIPYNKRVHKQFGQFAGFQRKWSQTYVAQGKALAAVILYAAVGGTQPPLDRQRVAVRVRRGGPQGPVLGTKTASGNGNYTGDASWGVFGVVLAPEEIRLEPGETYAIEFETRETPESLRGFVNSKGQVSDERPGFNPYRKVAPDSYDKGTAYRLGTEKVDFDLDMQVIEYQAH